MSQRVLLTAEWATLLREVIRQEVTTKQCLSEKVSILHYFVHLCQVLRTWPNVVFLSQP